jgi:hypothetical protein
LRSKEKNMDDAVLRAELDRLVPPMTPASAWSDVLGRAARIRRRRRNRTASAVVASVAVALVAALGAGGQIGALLSHSKEPHLLLRGELRSLDGARIGSLEIELHRTTIWLGRRVRIFAWGPRRSAEENGEQPSFPARWFLENDTGRDDLGRGSLDAQRGAAGTRSTVETLCSPCRARDSGRIELSWAQVSALVNDELTFVLQTKSGERLAAGAVRLDRSRLHRAVACRQAPARSVRCTRIYTGFP